MGGQAVCVKKKELPAMVLFLGSVDRVRMRGQTTNEERDREIARTKTRGQSTGSKGVAGGPRHKTRVCLHSTTKE